MKLSSKKLKNSQICFLGDYLKSERLRAGYSQKEVSKKIGISCQFISNIENNLCFLPLKHLESMVDLYKLDKKKLVKKIINQRRKFLKLYFGIKK